MKRASRPSTRRATTSSSPPRAPKPCWATVGVAVHPEDERYASLASAIRRAAAGRPPHPRSSPTNTPIPALGTGAVKITPAHDFNDFEVGKRHNLEQINIFTTHGVAINDDAPERLSRPRSLRGAQEDRRRSRALAEENPTRGLDHIEDKKIMVPHDEKSKLVVIEPFLTDQWWVKAETLAKPAIAAVREGRTKFVPQQLREDLFRLDAQHQAVVHLAPAVVGSSDPGVVWPGRRDLRRL
jgi:valyl-tRNA synthetase